MHKPTLLLLLLLAASVPGFARAGDVQEEVAERTDIDTEAADTGDSDVEVEVDDVDFRDADREIRDADGEGRAADGEVRADDGKDRTADDEVTATDGETADAEGEVRAADGEVKRVDDKGENADGEVKTADGRDRGGEAAVERDAAYASQAPVVRVHGGRIRGKVMTSSGGRRYFAYMGIPYAKPPEGDLRFKFPRRLPEKAWSGVRRCDQIPPKCPQLSYPERVYEGDEDCLYLNVYTHRTVDMSVSLEELLADMRPVLVWLHGGNFQHGSGTFDDVGPERFMDNTEDIVLVVPNYRLNALGFLSINEHPAVGNAGMKDIFKALSWLHGNIPQFGGHPGKTTLGGFEAGGAAAHLHALSPLSSVEPNLFEQTMSMSGTALAPWAVVSGNEARRRAIMLGRELSCVKKGVPDAEVDGPAMVRCLRTKSAESIVFACDAVLDWHGDISFPFVPSVENFDGHNRPFMIAHPEDVLREGGAALRGAKTWVSGITTHDGLPQALGFLSLGFECRRYDGLGELIVPAGERSGADQKYAPNTWAQSISATSSLQM